MQMLKFGMVGALLAQGLYLINGDKELKKKINASSGWKQWKQVSARITDKSNDVMDKAQHIDYESQRKHIKDIAHEKEKDLQKHIKKLQSYADSLGEKKLKEIVDDIQSSSEEFVQKIQPTGKKTTTTKKPTARRTRKTTTKKTTRKTTVKKPTKTTTKKKTPTKKPTAKKTTSRKKSTK